MDIYLEKQFLDECEFDTLCTKYDAEYIGIDPLFNCDWYIVNGINIYVR